MNWNVINTVATVISTAVFILTALYVRAELKGLEKDRYIAIVNQLFVIWESKEFMDAQLWLLHRLEQTSWESFVEAHRADAGEAAFHRVGSFYDHIGRLLRLGLVQEGEILTTIGPYAIAVWQKIQPLVYEARRIENSVLFEDFERLLPSCHHCYVPALGENARVNPFSLTQPGQGEPARAHRGDGSALRISAEEVKKLLDGGSPITLLDVRQPTSSPNDSRALPNSVRLPPGEIDKRYAELPRDREVIAFCA